MAYYMVARMGRDPLMNGHLRNDTLSHGILRSAIRGLVTPRGVELGETCRLIFGPKSFHPRSASNCPSRTPTDPAALGVYQKV